MTRAVEVVPSGVPGRNKAERVQAMFGRIVRRYDRMNRLMTFGMDGGWRRATIQAVDPRGKRVLDLGTGTGDLAREALRGGATEVVGADFVLEMLRLARSKCESRSPGSPLRLAQADALRLPFADQSFDCVISGFLLRNVADLPVALSEMARVLVPGGRLACLEITHPPSILAPFFRLYFDGLIPLLGAVVTGQGNAYRYLPQSLGPLPVAPELAGLIEQAGFTQVTYRRLGLGTVALHVGRR